ncbi:MAG: 1-phosphofructokinase family hexose kinase, partial [Spirochaeta sp.]
MKQGVVTITLNPSIDETVEISGFSIDRVNRVESSHRHAGGKAVNAARMLAEIGGITPITAVGFMGQDNDAIFRDMFQRHGIEDRFIRIPGVTREGIKIIDSVQRTTTEINYPGSPVPEDIIPRLFELVRELAETRELFIISGSLPPGVPSDIYHQLIREIKSYNCRVILDAADDALKIAVSGNSDAPRPDAIKPNITEMEDLVGARIESPADALRHGRELLDAGIMPIVSLGSEGAVFADSSTRLHAQPPKIDAISTV